MAGVILAVHTQTLAVLHWYETKLSEIFLSFSNLNRVRMEINLKFSVHCNNNAKYEAHVSLNN